MLTPGTLIASDEPNTLWVRLSSADNKGTNLDANTPCLLLEVIRTSVQIVHVLGPLGPGYVYGGDWEEFVPRD